MKKLIILLVLLFNLVPYYYQGSLKVGIEIFAGDPYGDETFGCKGGQGMACIDLKTCGKCQCEAPPLGVNYNLCAVCGGFCINNNSNQCPNCTDPDCPGCDGKCCCGVENCPLKGQPCYNCVCGDPHCSIDNRVMCECCEDPHCEGCCGIGGPDEFCYCCESYTCPTPNRCSSCNPTCDCGHSNCTSDHKMSCGNVHCDGICNCQPCSCGHVGCTSDHKMSCGNVHCDGICNCQPCSCGHMGCTSDHVMACRKVHCDGVCNCPRCSCGHTNCTQSHVLACGKVHCNNICNCPKCCCGKINCPKYGQPCETIICECCNDPHCKGCCAACSPSNSVSNISMSTVSSKEPLLKSISQTASQSTDPKLRCFFCGCAHYRCKESHYLDECHECVGGNTGKQACKQPEREDCPQQSQQNANQVKYYFDRAAWAGNLTTLQTTIESYERSTSLFRDRTNGEYSATDIKNGDQKGVDIITSKCCNNEFIADVHTHTDYGFNCFSVGDFYNFAENVRDFPSMESCYVIAEDGTVYAMRVEDKDKLVEFIKKYPKEDNYESGPNGPTFKKNSELYKENLVAGFNFACQGYSNNDSYAYGMAHTLFSKSGIKLLKQENDGSFKEIHASKELTTDSNGKPAFKFSVSKCK